MCGPNAGSPPDACQPFYLWRTRTMRAHLLAPTSTKWRPPLCKVESASPIPLNTMLYIFTILIRTFFLVLSTAIKRCDWIRLFSCACAYQENRAGTSSGNQALVHVHVHVRVCVCWGGGGAVGSGFYQLYSYSNKSYFPVFNWKK